MDLDPISRSYDECAHIHITDSTNINDINFRPDLSLRQCASNSNFRARQNDGIIANCLVGSLVRNIATRTSKSEAYVKSKYMNKCAGKNPIRIVGVSDTVVPLCDARVIYGPTELTACMINNMQDDIINEYIPKENNAMISSLIFALAILLIIIFIISISKRFN